MKSLFVLVLLSLASMGWAQDQSQDNQPHIIPKNLPQPKEEPTPQPEASTPQPTRESSSKDSESNSGVAPRGPSTSEKAEAPSDVHEMLPYDPHKAAKDVEVGQYYLKHKNYRAALDRFNEALVYKPNDAEATFYLAQTQEKAELYGLAYQNYQNYLKIVNDGPFAKDCQEAMKRIEPHLAKSGPAGQPSGDVTQIIQEGEAYLARNDFEAAHASFARALEIAPDDPVGNFRIAQSLQGLQRLDEARIFYKKYLTLQPTGKMANDAKREIAQINYILGKS